MEKVISAKMGFWAAIFFIGFVVSIPIGIGMLSTEIPRLGVLRWIIGIILLISPFLAIITIPTIAGTRVSRKGVVRLGPKMLPGVFDFEWTDVISIVDEGAGVRVELRESKGGQHISRIVTDWVVNGEEMKKAMFEAATLANPKVLIESRNLEKWGPPPYGVFSEKKIDKKYFDD